MNEGLFGPFRVWEYLSILRSNKVSNAIASNPLIIEVRNTGVEVIIF